MSEEDKPLSLRVAQGWEIVSYTVSAESTGFMECFLLRKQKAHKVLRIRQKAFGKGFVVKEMDV